MVCFDYNGDGWTDVFIANDSMQNFLFSNRGDGTFDEVGIETGVALSDEGKAEAGMGVDAADYDGDGRPDLFITHLDLELNRLYRNLRTGSFEDATFRSKIGARNFRMSGFGTRFIDYDNDGWRDLFIANGHVLDNIAIFHADTAYAGNQDDVSQRARPIRGCDGAIGAGHADAASRPRGGIRRFR